MKQPRFIAWLLLMAALLGALGWQLSRGLQLDSDILALLPEQERGADDALINAATTRYSEQLARQLVFLLGSTDAAQALSAARQFEAPLLAAGLTSRLDAGADPAALTRFLATYRYQWLSPQLRDSLRAGKPEDVVALARTRLYSPLGLAPGMDPANDPLGLTADLLLSLPQDGPAITLRGGRPMLQADGKHWAVLAFTLPESPFSLQLQQQLGPLLEAASATLPAGIELHGSGVLRHAIAAADSARQEISTVGIGSLAGVILLLLLVFRSPRPLLLCLLAIGCGVLTAFVITTAAFGRIHLLTLVFGASLVGMSIDYALHFFCDRFQLDWNPETGLRRVLPGIALGLVTSLLGFAGLALAPFPGLQQMALFSAVGLLTAWLTVVCACPVLGPQTGAQHAPLLLRGAGRCLHLVPRLPWRTLLLVLTIIAVIGLARLSPQDDIRLLQTSPQVLLDDEQRVNQLFGGRLDSRFVLVIGADEQQLLQREAAATRRLAAGIAAGEAAGLRAVSQQLPSRAEQQQNWQLLAEHVYHPAGKLPEFMHELGFQQPAIDARLADFKASKGQHLDATTLLASPLAAGRELLWLGHLGDMQASIIALRAVRNPAALAQRLQGLDGVLWVDRVARISGLLGDTRRQAGWLIAAAYALVLALLLWRYGLAASWRLLLPPALASMLAVGAAGLAGGLFNLFNLFALLIVLGVGVDYTIFYREAAGHAATTVLAIMLAAATTVLSFGLLALSATPMIHSFGLTLLVGVSAAFLLAPLALPKPGEPAR